MLVLQCRLFDENLMTQIKNAERSSPTLAERARVAHQRPRPWKTAAHAVSPRTFALCIAIYGLGVRCDDVDPLVAFLERMLLAHSSVPHLLQGPRLLAPLCSQIAAAARHDERDRRRWRNESVCPGVDAVKSARLLLAAVAACTVPTMQPSRCWMSG